MLPEIWGTLYSSLLALFMGTLFGLAVAIFLSEHYLASFVFSLLKLVGLQFHPVWGKLPDRFEHLLKNLIELLAAIPSVVYGLWGIFFIIPLIRPFCLAWHAKLGWIPIFGTTLSGPGMLPAALVLSIMILPTISAISLNALLAVPPRLREAAYGLGATRWESILAILLPTASKGIFGAIILAFGRALGETMALAMLVGNSNVISWSLFFTRQHFGRLAGKQLRRSRSPGNRCSHVRSSDSPWHHYPRQYGGGLRFEPGLHGPGRSSLMSETDPPSPAPVTEPPAAGIDLGKLEKSLRRPRTAFNFVMSGLETLMTIMALVPLFSVVLMLLVRGGKRLSLSIFTQLPPSAFEDGGGFGNAIVGTIVMVGLAALISVPFGVLGAVFLAEVGPQTKLAKVVRMCAKVLTGFPSILAGVFAYGAVVLVTGGFSALAGGIALSILMLPTVMLTAEEAIRMVPSKMREAAIGMGATQTQTVWMVLLPTAFPGILTGVMLAIARAAGETAPLLFTALFSNYWLTSGGRIDFMQPMASLAVLIYNFSAMPFENQVNTGHGPLFSAAHTT